MKASGTRHYVLLFAVVLAIITYIDRVAISVAAPRIAKDLQFTDKQFGFIFGAFAIAYALFEIPGGWMGDKWGPRKVLARIVLWWSFFTAATGWATNFIYLIIVRFLFGAGEAGAYPNITKSFSTWFPPNEKSRAQGVIWMASRWGGAFTPVLMAGLLTVMDWRIAFQFFGVLGVIWVAVFFFWYRDNPKNHPAVNEAELAIIGDSVKMADNHGPMPWGKLTSSSSVLLLWLQYFMLSYGWYFYITFFPKYVQGTLGFDLASSGAILSGMPLLLGGFGCLLSGFLTPKVATWVGDAGKARKIMAITGMLLAGTLLLVSLQFKDPLTVVFLISFSSFANDLVMPPAWNTCMDVGGKFAGTLSGSMNMMGNLAGFTAPVVTGFILEASGGDYTATFYNSAIAYFLGALCWLGIDSKKPIS
ncbi:MAG: MFS transporter [Bryobacter sp.]